MTMPTPIRALVVSGAALLLLVAGFHAAPAATALHGITVRLSQEGRVVVATCRYDGGIPAAGAQATVFAPGEDTPFLTGTTDPAGLFAFLPGTGGEWRVVVDDGMGHRREARLEVAAPPGDLPGHERWDGSAPAGDSPSRDPGEAGHSPDAEHHHGDDAHEHDPDHLAHEHDLASSPDLGDSDRPWKLATGLGLIFGLTGFAYGFTARRQRGK
jgi:nickel transport protein